MTDRYLLENGVDALLMEDGTSYYLNEQASLGVNQVDARGMTDIVSLTIKKGIVDNRNMTDFMQPTSKLDLRNMTDTVSKSFTKGAIDARGMTDIVQLTRQMAVVDSRGMTDSIVSGFVKRVDQVDALGRSDSVAKSYTKGAVDSRQITDVTGKTQQVTRVDAAGRTDNFAAMTPIMKSVIDSRGMTDVIDVQKFGDPDESNPFSIVDLKRRAAIDFLTRHGYDYEELIGLTIMDLAHMYWSYKAQGFNNMARSIMDQLTTVGYVGWDWLLMIESDMTSGVLDVITDYGAVGDSVTDDTLAINNAIAAAASFGFVVLIPPAPNGDTYLCLSKIKLVSGARIEWHGWLQKGYASGTGETGAFLTQENIAVKITDVHLWGTGGVTNPSLNQGNLCFINGDRIFIRDLVMDGFSNSRAWNFAGDDIHLDNCGCINPTQEAGNGGFRYYAGNGFRATNCWGSSGDDLFQLVPPGNNTSNFFNQDITNAWYIGCHGRSYIGRICVTALATTGVPGVPEMDSNIIDSGFIACTGFGGRAAGINISNQNSSGVIRNVHHIGCTIDQIYADNRLIDGPTAPIQFGPGDIYINAYDGTGGIQHCTLRSVAVRNSPGCSAAVLGSLASDILFEDCEMERSALQPTEDITSFKGTRIKVKGGYYDCKNSGTYGLRFRNNGGAATAPVDPMVEDATIVNIPNGGYGLGMSQAFRPRIKRNTFMEFPGSTTAKAFQLVSTCVDPVIIENDYTTYITSATKFQNSATGTTISDNNR